MPLIKNPKGVVVSVTKERKDYLLKDNPPVMDSEGNPRKNNNGKIATHLKAMNEYGWTEPSADEIAEYNSRLEDDQSEAAEAAEAREAAGLTAVAAALATQKAAAAENKASKKAGRPSKAAKAAEAEAQAKLATEAKVRDAEGDKEKFDALNDEEKEMYAALGLPVITA